MKRLSTVLLWATVAGTAILSASADEPLLPYRSLRAMGLGNAYEAVGDDLWAMDYNPAGLAHIDSVSVGIIPFQTRISADLVDEAKAIADALEEINDLSGQDQDALLESDAIDALVDRIASIRQSTLKAHARVGVARLAVPLPEVSGVRLVGAVGVSNQLVTGLRVNRAGLAWGSPVLDVLDDEWVIDLTLETLTTHFALAAEKDLDAPYVRTARAGLSYRLVRRNTKLDRFTLTDMLDPDRFKEEHFDTTVDDGEIDSIGDIQDVIDNNTERLDGSSVSFGVQVDHTDYLASAVTLRNLISSVGDSEFPLTLTAALAAKPLTYLDAESSLLELTVTGALSASAGDDAHTEFEQDSFTDNLHLGAEAVLFPHSPVNLAGRVGNNQGFLTAALELRLAVIHIGAGYFGDLEADYWTGGLSFLF